jgi:GNAT superfamily N-acetyltransferase
MTYCHSGYIFVAELEDSPVGFVTTLPIDSDQGHIYFWQLGVLPKYRNAGIGSKLVRHVLSNRSVVEFSVNIDPGNKPSLIIFEFGARSIGKCLQDMKISKNSPEAKVFAKYGENLYRSK